MNGEQCCIVLLYLLLVNYLLNLSFFDYQQVISQPVKVCKKDQEFVKSYQSYHAVTILFFFFFH